MRPIKIGQWALAFALGLIAVSHSPSAYCQETRLQGDTRLDAAQPRIPLFHRLVRSKPLMAAQTTGQPGSATPIVKSKSASKFTLCAFNTDLYMQTSLYALPTDGGAPQAVRNGFSSIFRMQSASHVGDYYYLYHIYGPELTGEGTWYVYDIMQEDDGWLNGVGEDLLPDEDFAVAQTVDPGNNTIYGIAPAEGGYRLFTMSYEGSDYAWTITTNTIGVLPGEWNAIAIGADGRMYGTRITRDDTGVTGSTLCMIDKATAAVTPVGETGEKPYKPDGAVIDPNTGTFYWLVQEALYAPTRLVTLNLSTGQSTTLATYDDSADMFPTALFSIVEQDPSTPNRPTDLGVVFEGKSLSGTLSFKAPESNIDGGKSETLSYVVAYGEKSVTRTCGYGETVTVAVTVQSEGYHQFGVKVINGGIESSTESVTAYAGRAIPPSVAPQLVYDETAETFTVTWKEPDTKYVQGYLDKENITYTVTRFPGEVVVAENIKRTEFSESTTQFPDNFTRYYYTVDVFHEEIPSSSAGVTEACALGYLIPPFTEDFNDSRRSITGYTIIDRNDDDLTWKMGINNLMIFNPSTNSNDDWFISPAAYLERGKTYFIEIDAMTAQKATQGNGELLALYAGTAPTTPALIDGRLLGNWKITGNEDGTPEHLKASFTPEATGFYYFGFNCTTRKGYGTGMLIIDNFTFSTGVSPDAPAAPVITSVQRQINGKYEADVTVSVPDKNFSGAAITTLSKLDVMRDGEIVKTFDNPAPGSEVKFTDAVDKSGDYTWKAVAYNDAGAGKISDAVVAFVGQDIAAAPKNFKVVETEYGKMHASWDRVTTDRNGNSIDPSRVTYTLIGHPEGDYKGSGMTVTELDFDGLKRHDLQQWKRYTLYACNDSGYDKNLYAVSEPVIVGEPQDEYVENFEQGYSDFFPALTLWDTAERGHAYWEVKSVLTPGIFAYDDGGYIAMAAGAINESASLVTPRIRLYTQENPAFTCMVYHNSDGETENVNEIDVEVLAEGSGQWIHVARKTIGELAPPHGWGRMTVSLEDFADKTVQVKIKGTAKNFSYTVIDDIAIKSMAPCDMAVDKIDVPAAVEPGQHFKATVKLTNHGTKTATDYTLTLDAGGEILSADVIGLASGETAYFDFDVTMPGHDEAKALVLVARVSIADDADNANNAVTVTVDPLVTNLPAPVNLAGATDETGHARINWDAPTDTYHPVVTETFGDGEAFDFTQNFKDWIFVDRDKQPGSYYYVPRDIPNYTPKSTETSFFIWNGSFLEEFYGDMIVGVDDSNYLCALSRDDLGECDDWAITPELDGSAQTVTFKVRSFINAFAPEFDVYYSTGSIDPDDFAPVTGMTGLKPVPGYWTNVVVRLPQGARRMAIRSRSKGSNTMLNIDNVKYISAKTQAVSPDYYNIYRDELNAGRSEAAQRWWTDAEGSDGSHEYRVTAVYSGLGESVPTRGLVLETSGIDPVENTGIKVSVDNRIITVLGCGGREVRVYDVMGRTVFSDIVSDPCRINVTPGIYLVDAGGHSFKLIVE